MQKQHCWNSRGVYVAPSYGNLLPTPESPTLKKPKEKQNDKESVRARPPAILLQAPYYVSFQYIPLTLREWCKNLRI